jgi:ATP-dependent RNA helicase DeaD
VRSVEPRGGDRDRDRRPQDRDLRPQDRDRRAPDGPRADKPRGGPEDYVAFRISYGSRDGADPRRLLAAICRRGRIDGDQVGAIRVGADHSTFEVRKEVAGDFGRATKRPDPKNPRVRIFPINDAPKKEEKRDPRDGGHAAPRRKKSGHGRFAER